MPKMPYSIRQATIADIPHIVRHRELMFREMGIPAEFEDMTAATELWLRLHPELGGLDVRFDVIAERAGTIEHLPDAF